MKKQKLEILIEKTRKILGSRDTEYEAGQDFIDFELLKQKEPLRSQILDWGIDILQLPKNFGTKSLEDETLDCLEEWLMIVFQYAHYPKAVPTIIKRYEEYEGQGWSRGWSDRSAICKALMGIGGEDVLNFIIQKSENEENEFLKDKLKGYIEKNKAN